MKNGEYVLVESVRGKVQAVALVTARLRPMTVMGEKTHLVGVPWQFGWGQYKGEIKGDSANLLSPSVGDPNTGIPETKAFMVNVRKA